MSLKIIAAVAENGVIGSGGALPWRLADDMKWFKKQTGTSAVVMGRKTFDSLPRKFRPLPNRENIVLTRNPSGIDDFGVTVLGDFQKVVKMSKKRDVWVIGGGEIYRLALPHASHLYLTLVDVIIAGDTFFPRWNKNEWQMLSCERHPKDAGNEHSFRWEVWRHK
ncbi:MAG: hypothetical protein A3J09_02730 [Candidatus Zambryskibacteria bacterium RIFCSPLOWO2_02_FULL_51_21]|uniref:Dihydrofolate reductase n=1 Tax=Candidatus Zambryskibacteria bacterium RIFCSPHIGHO2_02_FULL_43_37 TaxID=1802749 RepID=A0A1G2TG78_9BACT|nr:MAG: hypothetical protein A2723_02720 [Candidatus Zambryskibacteria bacterium RIFCSPHIGHO2_01_FULL_52_18]OHA96304.1 MAG: hypothetical protein A3D49_00170 [Candidatus Zambryskibacteria bacterium RIFCSPHIGHO2_02_FULL_43_37]OHB07707.1 MAG: hypothetical protein A2944_00045 [Candidatus Zambryskibacteria bacterium RIFCSPLOWO2_01_FULL_52_12]OHB11437.1 MAG: hypothetical protein A3J09_02730 [Candidatus Zambryskibacteria bacterium RIFCSPLOWO2_02_FULL_51_21]